jgi:hypothetical protein
MNFEIERDYMEQAIEGLRANWKMYVDLQSKKITIAEAMAEINSWRTK